MPGRWQDTRKGGEGLGHTWSMCASSMLPFFSNTTSKSVSGSCTKGQRELRVKHKMASAPAAQQGEIMGVQVRPKTTAPPQPLPLRELLTSSRGIAERFPPILPSKQWH